MNTFKLNYWKNTKPQLFVILFILIITGCGADDEASSLQETSSEQVSTEGEQITTEVIESTVEPTDPTIDSSNLLDEEVVLALVNDSRIALGLQPLVLNDALNDAAYNHSADMLENDYFDHTGLDGSRFWDRAEAAGYQGQPRGENIASGQRSPEAVHDAWMNSDGHRANILTEDITEMGLGRAGNIWTQIFGREK